MAMSCPRSIDYTDDSLFVHPSVDGDGPCFSTEVTPVTPGRIFRDSQVYGIQPGLLGEAVYDDDSSSTFDADSDPRVGLTDSLDPDFYASGEYEAPSKLKTYFKDKVSEAPVAVSPVQEAQTPAASE